VTGLSSRACLLAVLSSVALLAVPAGAGAHHKPDHEGSGGAGTPDVGGGGQGGGGTGDGGAAPQPTTISALEATPNPFVFGGETALSGRLSGDVVRGVNLGLEADETRPYGDAYVPATTAAGTPLTAATDNAGRFTFRIRPRMNTQYRAVAQTAPPLTSAGRLVLVRPHVGLIVSDRTPRAGSRVRFRGTVRPAHDGRTALIQRRSPGGRWVTVARARLRDAGTVFSTYSRRLRVRRDGVYRVKLAGDADHVNGFSREIALAAGA